MLALGGSVERRVFQHPSVFVEEKDSVESGGKGGVDIALGAITDSSSPAGRLKLVAREGDYFSM